MSKLLGRRARLLSATRLFFEARGFLEVETPVLVPSPGLDLHLDAFDTNSTYAARYLITSPEYQMKRLLVSGHPRIFQIVRCFRRGERGERHNPEFTMLEFYRAPGDMLDVMRDTEQLVAALTGGEARVEHRGGAGGSARVVAIRPPFPRMRVTDAFREFANVTEDRMLHLAHHDEEGFFRTLAFEIEPKIAELPTPLFLTHYPTPQASLAKRCDADPRYSERFELYVAGIELCNGFSELTDASEQRARFEADRKARESAGKSDYPIDEKFLAALEQGLPRCGGNAIGLDRLFAIACGVDTIADLLSFTVDEL